MYLIAPPSARPHGPRSRSSARLNPSPASSLPRASARCARFRFPFHSFSFPLSRRTSSDAVRAPRVGPLESSKGSYRLWLANSSTYLCHAKVPLTEGHNLAHTLLTHHKHQPDHSSIDSAREKGNHCTKCEIGRPRPGAHAFCYC